MMKKTLNVGIIGYGFMGRAHSNAYLQVNHFFEREHQPVLKACYGREEEVRYFLDNIEAGVIYANRPQGATTGAWPGYQAFGGWKGSGSTGKAIGSYYYLPLYLREQSQTVVE